MATTPCMHSRRDANTPTGVPNSYVPSPMEPTADVE